METVDDVDLVVVQTGGVEGDLRAGGEPGEQQHPPSGAGPAGDLDPHPGGRGAPKAPCARAARPANSSTRPPGRAQPATSTHIRGWPVHSTTRSGPRPPLASRLHWAMAP